MLDHLLASATKRARYAGRLCFDHRRRVSFERPFRATARFQFEQAFAIVLKLRLGALLLTTYGSHAALGWWTFRHRSSPSHAVEQVPQTPDDHVERLRILAALGHDEVRVLLTRRDVE
jgi:hypothetical protein